MASGSWGHPTLLLLHDVLRLMRQMSLPARSEMNVTSAGVVQGALLPSQWRIVVHPDIAQVRPREGIASQAVPAKLNSRVPRSHLAPLTKRNGVQDGPVRQVRLADRQPVNAFRCAAYERTATFDDKKLLRVSPVSSIPGGS